MDEKEKKEVPENADEKLGGDLRIKLPVSERLSNFWYHYKWHTIVSAFVVIVLVVLTVQLCSREKYDVFILYAGDKAVLNVSEDGNVPERTKFLNSFESVSSDFDGNGEVNVAFKSMYRPDEDEIERRKRENLELAENQIFEDGRSLDALIAQSDYYLLLLDLAVFREYAVKSKMIGSVEQYLPSGFKGERVREGTSVGVYLKDTGFSEFEGLRDLPDDTVICIKYANAFASEADEKKRDDAIAVFKNIVSIPAVERFDLQMLYAGDKRFSTDADNSAFDSLKAAVCALASDIDGDGRVSVGLKSFFRPDEEELGRLEESGVLLAIPYLEEEGRLLSAEIEQGKCYLLFLDLAVFREYALGDGTLCSVDSYLTDAFSGELVREGDVVGVYLKDTALYAAVGDDFPSDTVVCIRAKSADAADTEAKSFAAAVELFKKITAPV